MPADRPPNNYFLIVGNAEAAVVLREPLIEPERSRAAGCTYEQVRVLVKNNCVRIVDAAGISAEP